MTMRFCKLMLPILIGLTLILTGCLPPKTETAAKTLEVSEGYRAVCWGDTAFMAVGTAGRIDRIKDDGAGGVAFTTLSAPAAGTWHGIAYANGRYVVVGDGGVIAVAGADGVFTQAESDSENALLSVAAYGSNFVAVGRKGTVLTSSDGKTWAAVSVGVHNDFLSVASDGKTCMAVTYEGQVLIFKSLTDWEVLDYNEVYKTLGTLVHMRAVSRVGNGYFVMGNVLDNDNKPAVFSTETGELFTELNLDRINDTLSGEFWPVRPNTAAMCGDQVLLAADGGKLLTLTDCSQCTKLTVVWEHNINGMAVDPLGNTLLVGDTFATELLEQSSVRMYDIKAEQALADQQNGGVIIDVRTAEEFAEGHIPDAVHLPVGEVAEKLAEVVPDKDTKLIFYCSVGGRSQTALETAIELGYTRVYNLGGLEKGVWPYEMETGTD